jgi:hypothetical protein
MVMHIAVTLLLAHSHSHSHSAGSGGHSTSGASGGTSLTTHQRAHFTKHVVGATLISHYLIWNSFENAVEFTFREQEEYYIYNLEIYNEDEGCIYYSVYENPLNFTEINGNNMIISSNITLNNMIISKIYVNRYCKKESQMSPILKIIIGIVIFLVLICICRPNNENYNSTRML